MQQPLARDSHAVGNMQSVAQSDLLSSNGIFQDETINHYNDGSYLNIDKTSKNFTLFFWIFSLGSLILGFIIVGLMPNAYFTITDSQSKCSNPVIINSDNSLSCLDFNLKTNPKLGIVIQNLQSKNQHLIIDSHFFFNDTSNNTRVDQTIRIAQYRLTNDNKMIDSIIQQRFDLSLSNETRRMNFYTNQSKLLGVKSNLLYQHTIVASNVLVIVQLLNITDQTNIKNVSISAKYINVSYTKYQKHIRVAFFVLSILSFLLFVAKRRRIPMQRRILEHKFIFSLGFFLMIFNNPLISALFPGNNKFLVFLVQLTYILFPLCLIFFWLCVFERGDIQNNLQISEVIQKPFKWIIVLLLFIFTLSMYLFISYQHLKDYFGDEKEKAPFVGLRYTCFFLIIVCYVMIVYRIITIFIKNRMLRYRRFAAVSIFIIVLSLLFLLTIQYGIYSIQGKSMFLMLYFFNIYTYFLQFLYSKTKITVELLPPQSQNIIIRPDIITIHDVKKHPFLYQQQNKSQSKQVNPASLQTQIPVHQNDQQIRSNQQAQNKNNFSIQDPQYDINDQIGNIEELGQDLQLHSSIHERSFAKRQNQ